MAPQRKSIITISITVLLSTLIASVIWSGVQIYKLSSQRTVLKEEYSQVNNIYHGLLSISSWEEEIVNITEIQIRDFALTDEQDSLLRVQISKLLNDMITTADNMVQQMEGGIMAKLKKVAVNTFVDVDKIRQRIPELTDAIMKSATDKESMDRLQSLATLKLEELAQSTYDSSSVALFSSYFDKYKVADKASFNIYIEKEASVLQQKTYYYSIYIVCVMLLFLVMWMFYKKYPSIKYPLFIGTVILAAIVLSLGLFCPMIEIDARLATLDFVLMGEHIYFDNQMIFYRSKSIIEVVGVLLQSKQWDSAFVGFLILAFSVILPFSKLLTNLLYLFFDKLRNISIVKWLAFSSGKWSMADVMVVAIFMSYIAFDGIIDNQLSQMDRNSETVRAITTNETALQAGFSLFLAYVLFSLILSGVLKKITAKTGV